MNFKLLIEEMVKAKKAGHIMTFSLKQDIKEKFKDDKGPFALMRVLGFFTDKETGQKFLRVNEPEGRNIGELLIRYFSKDGIDLPEKKVNENKSKNK
jgi:hypothetical protein